MKIAVAAQLSLPYFYLHQHFVIIIVGAAVLCEVSTKAEAEPPSTLYGGLIRVKQ